METEERSSLVMVRGGIRCQQGGWAEVGLLCFTERLSLGGRKNWTLW